MLASAYGACVATVSTAEPEQMETMVDMARPGQLEEMVVCLEQMETVVDMATMMA